MHCPSAPWENAMSQSLSISRVARAALPWTVQAVAAGIGAVYGFGFGDRIGGWAIGLVAALNAAFFCAVLASAAVSGIRRLAARLRRGP
jgi:hypothetical protein